MQSTKMVAIETMLEKDERNCTGLGAIGKAFHWNNFSFFDMGFGVWGRKSETYAPQINIRTIRTHATLAEQRQIVTFTHT